MPTLNVHLYKITNLCDDSHFDVADPYVKFELEKDNLLFDEEFGEQVSSKKKNDMNPVYSEDFKFEIRNLRKMVLLVTVFDDDMGSDDELGYCKIDLEDLELSSEPVEIRRKIVDNYFSPDSWIILKLSFGEVVEDSDATNLSYVGYSAYDCLRKKHGHFHHQLWNVTSGRVVGELHQTPIQAWRGVSVHPEGHDDWFPEIMGEILSRTKIWADVLSLGPPDGKFMLYFKEALSKIAESAAERDNPVIIRMMFGNIVGCPVNCDGVMNELTADLPPDANINLWVGAWRRGVSWNHAKIIAVDGKYLHTGGHNMWDAHYLENDPVHDLSLELEGAVAHDGHLYANRQWNFVESRQETFWGSVGSMMPDSMPQVAKVRVTVSEWPSGVASEYPPSYRRKIVKCLAEQVDDVIPIITMGRYGCLNHMNRPSDDAFLAMIDSAQTIIHLALQDLGPVCIPSSKKALPGTGWPHKYLSALGKAIWERGVDVEIALSNPGSIPGDLSALEACYGNGWDCNDVASEIIKSIMTQYPDAEDDGLRGKVAENLRICFLREERGNEWEDSMTMGMHAKHFIIDDIAMYVGSQNLYVCDLAEWGVLIDDPDQTQKAMDEYWNPLWKCSYTGEDLDVQAVMDGLYIDRDGDDPADIDYDTRKKMKQAELANYGYTKTDLYDNEGSSDDED